MLDTFHRFIQRKDGFKRLAVGLCGWSWEDEFALLATEMGFNVSPAESKTLPYDLYLDGKKVQCKFECCESLPSQHSVDIRRRHERRYEKSDFDFMAIKIVSCLTKKFHYYFIPTDHLLDTSTRLKARIKLSSYSSFEDDWMVFCNNLSCLTS